MILAHVVAEKNIKIVMEQMNTVELAKYIEQTLLKPDVSREEIEHFCKEAIKYKFYGVCIPPYYLKIAKNIIKKEIKLITVVGFPLGFQAIPVKVEETKKALEDGADEIDVVINIAALKSKEYDHVKEGIDSIATLCRLKSKVIKVIIETGLLSDEEIVKSCEICAEIGVDFVKTSTGFFGGATVEQVRLIREHLPLKIKIKASGGIRDKESALKLIEAGADRIGTSAGTCMVELNG
jgi:deoxyribose-phosphate aldolase